LGKVRKIADSGKSMQSFSKKESTIIEFMKSEMIWVICDKCSRPMPSMLSMDAASLADPSKIRNNETRCACGHMVLWSKAELYPQSVLEQRFGDEIAGKQKTNKSTA
jgi:hypothetical protein